MLSPDAKQAVATELNRIAADQNLTDDQKCKLHAALEKAVLSKVDNKAEIKAITAQFRKIHESFTCTG